MCTLRTIVSPPRLVSPPHCVPWVSKILVSRKRGLFNGPRPQSHSLRPWEFSNNGTQKIEVRRETKRGGRVRVETKGTNRFFFFPEVSRHPYPSPVLMDVGRGRDTFRAVGTPYNRKASRRRWIKKSSLNFQKMVGTKGGREKFFKGMNLT